MGWEDVPFEVGCATGVRCAKTGVTGEYGGRGGVPGREGSFVGGSSAGCILAGYRGWRDCRDCGGCLFLSGVAQASGAVAYAMTLFVVPVVAKMGAQRDLNYAFVLFNKQCD